MSTATLPTTLRVAITVERCADPACWCYLTDAHGGAVQHVREVDTVVALGFLSDVPRDGWRGHDAAAWITDAGPAPVRKEETPRERRERIRRSTSWEDRVTASLPAWSDPRNTIRKAA